MNIASVRLYHELMSVIRDRLDVIEKIESSFGGDFARAEAAAFHGRKVVEGIAFGCLVATENGIKRIPGDAKGQWNAEVILTNLKKKNINTFPSPSIIRSPTGEEQLKDDVYAVVEGMPDRRICSGEFIAIYQRMHSWLHELNPYVAHDRAAFYAKNAQRLWNDLAMINRFIERHFISISGIGFFCVLRDSIDGKTKVVPLSKAQ